MPEYVDAFATAYDRFWAPYPMRMSEAWLRFHQDVAPEGERSLLDVGCGTGVLAARFAEAGYRITALDVSDAMLARARDRLAGTGAVLLRADAANFAVPEPSVLAVSTYDIPNHLGGIDRVRGYLRCVYQAVRPGGWFGFDLCTLRGLRADVAPVSRAEDGLSVEVARGHMHADQRPLYVSGEVRDRDGSIAAFTTTITNTAYPVTDVLAALADAGWIDCYVADLGDLRTPVTAPEEMDRVAIVARHG